MEKFFADCLSVKTTLGVAIDIEMPYGIKRDALLQAEETLVTLVTATSTLAGPPTMPFPNKEDVKADLAMLMTAELIRASRPALPMKDVRISQRGMTFTVSTPDSYEAPATVRIDLSTRFPLRIALPCIIHPSDPGIGGYTASVEFTDLSPSLEEALARYIFLLDRNCIQTAKAKS